MVFRAYLGGSLGPWDQVLCWLPVFQIRRASLRRKRLPTPTRVVAAVKNNCGAGRLPPSFCWIRRPFCGAIAAPQLLERENVLSRFCPTVGFSVGKYLQEASQFDGRANMSPRRRKTSDMDVPASLILRGIPEKWYFWRLFQAGFLSIFTPTAPIAGINRDSLYVAGWRPQAFFIKNRVRAMVITDCRVWGLRRRPASK